jgi:hypothetical protein
MKKFVSLLLVFSILLLSGNVFANAKRGAELIVVKKDGQELRGELIVVKESSLLLLGYVSAADVSIDICDIRVIRIKGRSKFIQGLAIGGLVGGAGGVVFTAVLADELEPNILAYLLFAGLYAAAGGLLGGIVGAAAGTGERTIQIEGKSDSEIQRILGDLRKKARVRDYK